MAFMERFHTIRFDRNGVMELIRVPHPANGDDAGNEPILPYGLVKVEHPIDDVMQPGDGHRVMAPHVNTDEDTSQTVGSNRPLLPVAKVENQNVAQRNEDVLPPILGTVAEIANSVYGRDERNTIETGDNSPRQVAVSEMEKVPLLGGETMIENTFSEMSRPTRRDKSNERPISPRDKDMSTDTTPCVKCNKPNVKVRANYAPEAAAMASLYPPQGVSGGSAVDSQCVPPGNETGQCSPYEQVAVSHNEAARLSDGSESTNNAPVFPTGNLTIPQRKNAPTVLSSSEQIAHVGGRGDSSTIIPNDDCLSHQLLLTETPGEYEQQPAKDTHGTNGHVSPRTSLPIIRLKAISKSSTAISNAKSALGWPRLPSAVYQTAKLVQHMSATVTSTPALAIDHPVSHAPANANTPAPPRRYFTHMRDALDKMPFAAKVASMKVMASTPPLSGSNRPLPSPLQSSTSTPEVAPSAYLVYPNGNVTPLFEVPNKLNVATNPPLGIRPLSASRNVGGNWIPQKRIQLLASPTGEMQPLLLPSVFPNPMPLIQGPLSPDLPETTGTITSTTSPTKRRQRKPSAALPLRSAMKTGPIKKTSAYSPGFARTLTSRSSRKEEAERIELDDIFGHLPSRSPVEPSVSNALPSDDGAPTTEVNQPTPSITCGSIYECWRSRTAHISRTMTRQLDGSNSRRLPTDKGWCDYKNEGHMTFDPDASPYRPSMPRVFRRPVPPFYDRSAFTEPQNRRHLNSDRVSEETTCPWYKDLYIPGGPGCDWGFRPIPGAAPLLPRVRCQRATTSPPRHYCQPPDERNNYQEHHENISIPRPRSASIDAPANDDTTLQVSGIDYGSIKRRRDTNEGQCGLSKQRRRNVVCTRTVAARSGRIRHGLKVRKHPVVPESGHFDIRPCSVVITRLDMDTFTLDKRTSGML